MVFVSDAGFECLWGSEKAAEVRRVETKEVAMHGEFLDLAILTDSDMDGGFGAGEWREGECDDGGGAIFWADGDTLVDGKARCAPLEDWDWTCEHETGDRRFLDAQWSEGRGPTLRMGRS